jgi:predicted secreted protein
MENCISLLKRRSVCMKRSKKILLASHCLLNVNSKVEGLATSSACARNIVDFLLDNDFGIIQMECQELTCMGIKRWGQSIDQYDNPYYEEHCNRIATNFVNMVRNYTYNGYDIKYVIGMDGSPTCGVNLTCRGKCGGENINFENFKTEKGTGMLMKAIKVQSEKYGIDLTFIGLNEERPEENVLKLKERVLTFKE